MSVTQQSLFFADEVLAEDYGYCERCSLDTGSEMVDDRLLCRVCAHVVRMQPELESDGDHLWATGRHRWDRNE